MLYLRFIPILVKIYFYYDVELKMLFHENREFKCAKKLCIKLQCILESLKFSFTIYVSVPFHSIYKMFGKCSGYTSLRKRLLILVSHIDNFV